MTPYLEERRESAANKLDALRTKLGTAEEIARNKACVYVTGSFGRGEASSHSDLDLFIVGRSTAPTESKGAEPALRRLDAICVKAQLILVTKELKFPDFSGDGQYLTDYTIDRLTSAIGTANDDADNTFTARLLLLLESKALLESDVYAEAIARVIDAYWRDFRQHEDSFVPAFLANDILRLWRTFCVNYEAKTRPTPPQKLAERRLKNYKLKHSRLLTCYSALAYLLSVSAQRTTVTPEDARAMVAMTPTERFEALGRELGPDHQRLVESLVHKHERFLRKTDATEADLVSRFMDEAQRQTYANEADEFGNIVHDILNITGTDTRLRRLLLV